MTRVYAEVGYLYAAIQVSSFRYSRLLIFLDIVLARSEVLANTDHEEDITLHSIWKDVWRRVSHREWDKDEHVSDLTSFDIASSADVGLADAPCFNRLSIPCQVDPLGFQAKLGLSWPLHKFRSRLK